jgi:hypothetical protein
VTCQGADFVSLANATQRSNEKIESEIRSSRALSSAQFLTNAPKPLSPRMKATSVASFNAANSDNRQVPEGTRQKWRPPGFAGDTYSRRIAGVGQMPGPSALDFIGFTKNVSE